MPSRDSSVRVDNKVLNQLIWLEDWQMALNYRNNDTQKKSTTTASSRLQ